MMGDKDSEESVYEVIVRNAIREILSGKKYDHDELSRWIDDLIKKILDRLADFRIKKYIVHCNIQHKCGAGLNAAASFQWDAESDVCSTVRWENESILCVVQ
ncbi:unnamed protein product, partial [Larinioides sclopetarius]